MPEYLFAENLVLENPLIDPIDEQFGEVITIVGLADNPEHTIIEVQ